MKLDKDTAIKHHFWLLLGLAVPLILVCLFVMLTVASAEIRKYRGELEKAHGSVNAAGGNVRNEKWVEGMRQSALAKKKEEEVVWGKAYDAQSVLFTWPVEFESKFHFQDGYFPITIKVSSKPPADKASVNDAKPPLYRLSGTIIERKEEKIIVSYEVKAGKKSVAMPPATFHRTPELELASFKKINKDGKDINFRALQLGDWVDVTYEKGKYFGDPMDKLEQEEFAATYKTQIEPIIAQVQPVLANGQGVVQFPGWFPKPGETPPEGARFFRHVAKEWQADTMNISEEAWLAQEDLWIQRELYRLVRLANDYVSVFKAESGGDPKLGQTFANPYWEITLKLHAPSTLQVKIKNLLPRRQKLDLPFLVKLHEPAAKQPPRQIIIGGREPLNPGEAHDTSIDVKGLDVPATGVYGLEQVINWETAAVKRIDHVSIGSASGDDICHSDRTFPKGLQEFKKGPAKGGVQPGGKPGMPGVQPGGQPGVQPGGGDLGGKGSKGGGNTPHGLHAARYSDVTKQSRQLPVGISLIVDQDHIDRVLLAFTNSPLRFLTTQVIMNRYPRSLRPTQNLVAGKSGGDTETKQTDGGDIGVDKGAVKMPGKGKGRFGGFGRNFHLPGTQRAQSAVTTGDSSESNMELVIYGIVTIYERYPPRK